MYELDFNSREEWLVWRQSGLGSSDIPILMSVSPYKKLDDLYLEKIGEKEPSRGNWATQRGQELEPIVRDIYEFHFNIKMPPVNFSDGGFRRASMDGFNKDVGYGIEIKVPGRVDCETGKRGEIPEKYYPQLQWQMMISNSKVIHYVTYDVDKKEMYVTVCKGNKKYQRRLYHLSRWFWHKVLHKSPLKKRTARIIGW